ncbi:hypothetical protein J2W22_004575 [Sphingomonas kyeonggiensis]|uniref:hypothetical protein n=1 Tax=Sphingomonas kyeonggiensis TaxID=1268553 RepID=UPI002782104F|nr:hypothetical protein [Sphingomonas kyeonggiensis]MDQ0252487.1 hypothetical protein [Sphingomonas kyeonggiensis]
MIEIGDVVHDLRVQLRQLDGEIATRVKEVRQGLLVQRELDALIERRNTAYQRLMTIQSAMGVPVTHMINDLSEFGGAR